jgi:hypothetical protein
MQRFGSLDGITPGQRMKTVIEAASSGFFNGPQGKTLPGQYPRQK